MIQTFLRVTLGLIIVCASLEVAHQVEMRRYQESHVRYTNCLKAGHTTKLCSISAVFSPTKFNGAN